MFIWVKGGNIHLTFCHLFCTDRCRCYPLKQDGGADVVNPGSFRTVYFLVHRLLNYDLNHEAGNDRVHRVAVFLASNDKPPKTVFCSNKDIYRSNR